MDSVHLKSIESSMTLENKKRKRSELDNEGKIKSVALEAFENQADTEAQRSPKRRKIESTLTKSSFTSSNRETKLEESEEESASISDEETEEEEESYESEDRDHHIPAQYDEFSGVVELDVTLVEGYVQTITIGNSS